MVNVTVNASDASGIEAVVVAYTDGSGVWASASLEQSQGSWSGSLAGSAGTDFLIQVVDRAGNVTVWDNEDWPNTNSIYLPLVTSNH
jgi:hypothetical protein